MENNFATFPTCQTIATTFGAIDTEATYTLHGVGQLLFSRTSVEAARWNN